MDGAAAWAPLSAASQASGLSFLLLQVWFSLSSPRRSVLTAFAVSVMPGGSSSDSPPSSEGRWVLTPLTDEQIEAVMKDIQENCDPTKM